MAVDLASAEVLLIIVMVVQRFRLHLVSGHREEPECILDMVPRHRVWSTLQRQPSMPQSVPLEDAVPAAACPWATARAESA
jgi:hypothetical protein